MSSAQQAFYKFVSYTSNNGVLSVDEVTSTYGGRLLDCSWTSNAREVVALTKKAEGHSLRTLRSATLHEPSSDSRFPLDLPVGRRKHTSSGPLAVAISPSGDSVTSMHQTETGLELLVLVRSSGFGFFVVKTVDVTHLLMQDKTVLAGTPGYSLGFTPCGRYTTIVDKSTYYGETSAVYGVIVVDLAARLDESSLRAQPMFDSSDQAPRTLHWTRKGVYLQAPGTDEFGAVGAKGGLLFLRAE